MSWLRRLGRILSAKPGALFGNAWVLMPLLSLASFAILGLPMLARSVKNLARTALKSACIVHGREPPRWGSESSWAGFLGVLGMVTLGGGALAIAVVSTHYLDIEAPLVRFALTLLVGSLGYVLLGAALAPLAHVLFVAVSDGPGSRGVFGPLAASFEYAARRGPRQSLLDGARAGALLGVVNAAIGLALHALALAETAPGSALLAVPVAVVFGAPFALAAIADAHVQVDTEQRRDAEPSRAPARLRALAWLLGPAIAGLLAMFAGASLVPSPMRHTDLDPDPRRGMRGVAISAESQRARLPGTSVVVRTTANGIAVEADDGGGAGAVDAGFDTTQSGLYVAQRTRGGVLQPSFLVAVTDGETWATTDVDMDGVRLDDSMAERTFGRLGAFGNGALAMALLLLLYLTFTLGSELGAARTLDAPSLSSDSARSSGLKALDGTLRVGTESTLTYQPPGRLARLLGSAEGALTVTGEAWIDADAGQQRFRLPERPVLVLGGDAGRDWDGERVVILSRFTSGGVTGLRESSVVFPDDGQLTLGGRDDASELLVRRAIRRASFLNMPILLGLGAAAFTLLAQL